MATAPPQNAAIAAAVKQMVDAATAPIKQAQGAYDTQSQANQGNVTGLTSALSNILNGIAPGVQKTYDDASSRQAAFAQGFSHQMQEQLGQNASNTSSFLQNIVGAPSSQISQVAGQVAPAAAGDTLYGLEGYIPASTLNEEGAAYTAAAKQLPATAYSQGLQQIGKIQSDQAAKDTDFAQQIGAEGAKAPQYTETLKNDAFDQAYKTRTLADNEAKTAASQKLAGAKFTLQQQVASFNASYKGASLKLAGQKFAQQTLNQDRSYGIALSNLGLKTASSKRAALAAEYKLKTGGFTPSQLAKYSGLLQDGINAITKVPIAATHQKVKHSDGTSSWRDTGPTFAYTAPDLNDPTGKKTIPITYADFVSQAVGHGIPISLALERANSFFPSTMRPPPATLAKLLGISPSASSAATGFAQQTSDYNKTVGLTSAPVAKDLLTFAQGMLGTPYKWGGNAPGKALDCSAFIQQTFQRVGINLPRTTQAQVKVGQPVSLDQLQAGDAIFTEPGKNGPNHVGMYVGNGMVQESPHTGDVNKVIPLKDFLGGGFVAARRYLGNG